MDTIPNESEPAASPEVEELQSEMNTLRTLMAITLLMLIGLSVCADYFVSRQTGLQRAGVEQFQRMAAGFPQAAAQDFLGRVREYAKTHPDYAPIVAKHSALFGSPVAGQPAPKP